MMNTDEFTVNTRNKVKRQQQNRKEDSKVKSISKENERRGREPSCRLGKNAKKQLARTSKILECDLTIEGDMQVDIQDPIIGVKQLRIRLARPRRKLGHRGRPEEPVFIEDEPEIIFTKQEISWQTASLDQDDSILP